MSSSVRLGTTDEMHFLTVFMKVKVFGNYYCCEHMFLLICITKNWGKPELLTGAKGKR
jgi:hypothetical protein